MVTIRRDHRLPAIPECGRSMTESKGRATQIVWSFPFLKLLLVVSNNSFKLCTDPYMVAMTTWTTFLASKGPADFLLLSTTKNGIR